MSILNFFAISLVLMITAPKVMSYFDSIDSNFICCENSTEEEKDFDDLEEYIVSQTIYVSKQHYTIWTYSFSGGIFIDIVSSIFKPPPELL